MRMKKLGIPSRGGWQNFSGMQWRQKLGTRWTIGSSPSAKKHQVVVVTFIQVSTLLQMWQDDKAKCWWWPSCRFGNWTKWVCWRLFYMDNVRPIKSSLHRTFSRKLHCCNFLISTNAMCDKHVLHFCDLQAFQDITSFPCGKCNTMLFFFQM